MGAHLMPTLKAQTTIDPVALARRLYQEYRAYLSAETVGQVAEELDYLAREEREEE